MFYTPVIRRAAYHPSLRGFDRNLERFFQDTLNPSRASFEQDDSSYTLQMDVPGLAKEHLSIGIEGAVVRITSLADAPRSFKAAYELPTEIDAATSQAKLENGVLTLKLGKKVPVNSVTQLNIN